MRREPHRISRGVDYDLPSPPLRLAVGDDPGIAMEGGQEPHQPLERELAEPLAIQRGHLRLVHTEQLGRVGLAESAVVDDGCDPSAAGGL